MILFFTEKIESVYFILQNSLSLLEFFFVSLFFLKVFQQKPNIFIKIVFFITIIIIGFILVSNNINSKIFQLHSVQNFATGIFCMFYYYTLLNKKEPSTDLFKSPSFWIVTGFFFSSCIIAPIYAIQGYISFLYGWKIGNYVLIIINIFIIIKYMFFMKAYWVANKYNQHINLKILKI